MKDYLTEYESALSLGARNALENLLAKAKAGEYPLNPSQIQELLSKGTDQPSIVVDDNITTVGGYNSTITEAKSDLGSLFAESANLWWAYHQITSNIKTETDRVKIATNDLEQRIGQIEDSLGDNRYTTRLTESFDSRVQTESNISFYQNGTFPQCDIDTDSKLLKLRKVGDFELNSHFNNIPPKVVLDRVLGVSVDHTHPVSGAFDGLLISYWGEVIHSSDPIFVQTPWLPYSYQGGAAARILIEFDRRQRFSELDFNIYGRYPAKVLEVGWVDQTLNIVPDPNFAYELSTSPGTYWWWSSLSYGVNNTGLAEVLSTGPVGSNCVHMLTYSSTGSVHIQSGLMNIPASGSMEVSAVVKSVGPVPIEFGITYYDSSGKTVDDILETFVLDTMDWQNIFFTIDPPLNSSQLKLRIGLPANLIQPAEMWIALPRVEFIQRIILSQEISDRGTVFLDTSILAKRVYITLCQENYSLKQYIDTINSPPIQGEDNILSFHKANIHKVRYGDPGSATQIRDNIGNLMFGIPGTTWRSILDLNNSEREATQRIVCEYILGAYEISFRHREYISQGRYVSSPIRLGGEIREISLVANDQINISPNEILYFVTPHSTDPPEQGILISNLSTSSSGEPILRFIPSNELEAQNPREGDILVSVQHIKERLDGTDRYGRIRLEEYPYINRELIFQLTTTITQGTSGQRIPIDPNATEIKYLNITGKMVTLTGYRPVLVTLLFRDGTRALPDILGAPYPGELREVVQEVLTSSPATISTTIQSTQSSVGSVTTSSSRQGSQPRPIAIYSTRFQNLAVGMGGIPITCWWHSSTGAASDIQIDSSYITVDVKAGLVTIAGTFPTSAYDQILGTYWYRVGEESLREPFIGSGLIAINSGNLPQLSPQTYPVTRNKTDLLNGIPPTLRSPNLDPLDPDYYPIYEYYVSSDGRIIFSQSFHPYSDTPAEVIVEYDTLALDPRLIIQMTRPEDSELTPRVSGYTVLANVRTI